MTEDARSERTARLLVARLDELTRTAGRLRHEEFELLVERAAVATMRAIALELLREERAEAIWREAHERNPELPVREQIELPERVAA